MAEKEAVVFLRLHLEQPWNLVWTDSIIISHPEPSRIAITAVGLVHGLHRRGSAYTTAETLGVQSRSVSANPSRLTASDHTVLRSPESPPAENSHLFTIVLTTHPTAPSFPPGEFIMHNKPTTAAKPSGNSSDPFHPSKCDQLKEPRWIGYGVAANERPYRFRDNAPVFGSSLAYQIARGQQKPNPDGLVVIWVSLDSSLSADDLEDHYRRVYKLSVDHSARGIEGTGIVMDASTVVQLPPNVQKTAFYYAVFPNAVVPVLQADVAVKACGASDNKGQNLCGKVRVPTWAHGAVSGHWNQTSFEDGSLEGFKVQLPAGFDRARLGHGNAMFLMDAFLRERNNPSQELSDLQNVTRVDNGADFVPRPPQGYVNPDPELSTVGHAEAVAVLAAGRSYGVSADTIIIPISIIPHDTNVAQPSDIIRTILWMEVEVLRRRLENRCVLCMPLKGGVSPEDLQLQGRIEAELIAQPYGIVVVHAAGDDNRELTPAAPLYPQMSDQICVVGGLGRFGKWWGEREHPDRTPGSNYGAPVTFVAPSESIPVPTMRAGGFIDEVNGTSFAAAFVSGLVSCLQDGQRTPADILDLIRRHHTRGHVFNIDSDVLSID
ncbi:subtilisin-like protein [Ascobolus immersus RN42]|uniref:Subtilisin-like protein n=1 Tax=Ascobolus immersus RN42 TaxID=1160509 RepID=A0A3N4I659_ASCIM|nr:subtilisin-like protein [Ascobolus immersus RN42]